MEYEPPPYAPVALALCDLPEYSQGSTNNISFPFSNSTHTPSRELVYHFGDINVALGPNVWGLDTPAYGCGAPIEGTIWTHRQLSSSTRRFSLQLQSFALVTHYRHGFVHSQTKALIYSETVSFHPTARVPFRLVFPNDVECSGRRIPAPASHVSHARSAKIELIWELMFCLERKGLRKNEKHTIPVLYLPKSRPAKPHLVDFPPGLPSDDARVKTCQLPLTKSDDLDIESAELWLPSNDCLASGSRIPVIVTIRGACTSHVSEKTSVSFMEALCSSTAVTLVKQTAVYPSNAASTGMTSETRVAFVQEFDIIRLSHNQAQLKGWLFAGSCGKDRSWLVPKVLQVKYLLKVNSKPCTPVQQDYHIPSFEHTEELALTTDPWGTSDWELGATHGVPIPALGLAK